MSINQSTDYSAVVSAVRGAIRKDNEAQNKWKDAGSTVAKFYGSEAAITEVKAQFLADAIIPELTKAHQSALSRELPRKGSKEYAAFVATHGEAEWDAAMKAKKDARSIAHTMFDRVVGYAFPEVKTGKAEAEPTKTLATKVADLINDAIGKCEKAEGATFDITATLGHLRAALAVVSAVK